MALLTLWQPLCGIDIFAKITPFWQQACQKAHTITSDIPFFKEQNNYFYAGFECALISTLIIFIWRHNKKQRFNKNKEEEETVSKSENEESDLSTEEETISESKDEENNSEIQKIFSEIYNKMKILETENEFISKLEKENIKLNINEKDIPVLIFNEKQLKTKTQNNSIVLKILNLSKELTKNKIITDFLNDAFEKDNALMFRTVYTKCPDFIWLKTQKTGRTYVFRCIQEQKTNILTYIYYNHQELFNEPDNKGTTPLEYIHLLGYTLEDGKGKKITN